jgi:hypothetical protein
MYYMMECFSPKGADHAMLTYKRDHPRRSWASGKRFSTNPNDPVFRQPPPEPVQAEVKADYPGVMAEFWKAPVPLMTKRLLAALQEAGVMNLDTYQAEIYDVSQNAIYDNYVAFNIIGTVSAADLNQSSYDATLPERMISVDFDSVIIDEQATRGALMFRLAESVNAIVVHEKVKQYLEENGIDTLTFIPPEEWAG